ncbi:hypothetical protein ACX27_07390 [Nostoc piscinale CENA21]|uniref:Uncharacterized protein n=1 Tax=Nostoc piscinale CENA21 TaxID=224013 RepID=A0A0M4SQ45_9NOSO|nr:hypothetical protein ACX27_07390 [Nostoc piscinale CENA21]
MIGSRSNNFGFWILDLPYPQEGYSLTILYMFCPNVAGLEPKKQSKIQNSKPQIGRVNNLVVAIVTFSL